MENTGNGASVNGEAQEPAGPPPGQQDTQERSGTAREAPSTQGERVADEAIPVGTQSAAPLAVRTLSGDLGDAVLDILREIRDPWHKLTESRQTFIAGQIRQTTGLLVERAVNLLAAQEFPAIAVILEQLAFKPKGIEAKLAMSAIDRATRHQLVDAQGKPVLIVIADPAAFMGARGPAKIDKQAPELPLDAAEPAGEAIGPLPDESGFEPDPEFAEADAADLKRPGNKGKRRPAVVEPHLEAQRIGKEDGLRGDRDHAARYPAGQYGHADDYEIGHALGQNERAALMATARELGAVAGKAGAERDTNPYPIASAEHDLWLAAWTAPEPGNNGTAEPSPKRRGRPRADPGRRDRSL